MGVAYWEHRGWGLSGGIGPWARPSASPEPRAIACTQGLPGGCLLVAALPPPPPHLPLPPHGNPLKRIDFARVWICQTPQQVWGWDRVFHPFSIRSPFLGLPSFSRCVFPFVFPSCVPFVFPLCFPSVCFLVFPSCFPLCFPSASSLRASPPCFLSVFPLCLLLVFSIRLPFMFPLCFPFVFLPLGFSLRFPFLLSRRVSASVFSLWVVQFWEAFPSCFPFVFPSFSFRFLPLVFSSSFSFLVFPSRFCFLFLSLGCSVLSWNVLVFSFLAVLDSSIHVQSSGSSSLRDN